MTPLLFQAQTQGMIQSLTIGECLELQSSQLGLMDQIASLGNIKLFIVEYDHRSEIPRHPFLLLFQNNHPGSQYFAWFDHPQCLGILIRQNDEAEIPELDKFKNKLVYFDFEVSSLESIQKRISFCEQLLLPYSFFLKKNESSKLINQILNSHPTASKPRLLDLPSSDFDNWAELENFQAPLFEQNHSRRPQYSIIIPHYCSPFFVTNVLRHLSFCKNHFDQFEILLVDDCSAIDQFHYIKSFITQHLPKLSIRLFRWPKTDFLKNGSRAFRAGASRNWGAHLAKGEYLFFLDSDMLVPSDFFSQLETSFQKCDVVQFKRLHIPRDLSSEATRYLDLLNSQDLYIEESQYWSQLFEADRWEQLKDHWKFCCTYGLGLKKSLFQSVGRIRRNFIQYGFEDTDLGYRLSRFGARMVLNKTPLLHLSSRVDDSQTFWYQAKKRKQLRPMAKNFYALNMDPHLYSRFRSMVD